jgi:hypothetical protein
MRLTNYIEDRNPFQMARPPAWWLEGLYNFDDQLVILPSRERMGVYWIARRVSRLRTLTDAAVFHPKVQEQVDTARLDTAMFLTYGVERVVDIVNYSASAWSLDRTLRWLTEHDTWAVEGGPLDEAGLRNAIANGGSKYTKLIEAEEANAEAKQKQNQRETIFQATGEGWRSLQARKGRRILNAGPATRPALAGV